MKEKISSRRDVECADPCRKLVKIKIIIHNSLLVASRCCCASQAASRFYCGIQNKVGSARCPGDGNSSRRTLPASSWRDNSSSRTLESYSFQDVCVCTHVIKSHNSAALLKTHLISVIRRRTRGCPGRSVGRVSINLCRSGESAQRHEKTKKLNKDQHCRVVVAYAAATASSKQTSK